MPKSLRQKEEEELAAYTARWLELADAALSATDKAAKALELARHEQERIRRDIKHRLPRRGVAAVLGSRPRDDDGIDSPLTQDNVQVRAKKAAVAMLLDDMLAGCRRQLRVDVHARRAIH